MSSKVSPSISGDKYNLNAESIKFAKYFYRIILLVYYIIVNNYEVKHLQDIFTELSKNKPNSSRFRSKFLLYVHYPNIPLMAHLFSIFEENSLSWNKFFQLTMFFSFAPTVSILFFLIHSIPPNQTEVSYYKLTNLLDMLITLPYFQHFHGDLFFKYDLNNDSNLSFNQFFNFASQVNELWDPINILRMNILKYIWNLKSCTNEKEYYRIIMNRRKNIIEIKDYQNNHRNKLPSMSCNNTFKSIFKQIPNPMKYTYGCSNLNEISFSELTNIMIRKYNDEYSYNKKELFAMKYLNSFNLYPMISEIDFYYIQYRSNLLQYNNNNNNNNSYKSKSRLRSTNNINRGSVLSSNLSDSNTTATNNNNNNNNNNLNYMNNKDININIISPVSILRMNTKTGRSLSNQNLSTNRRPFSMIKESDYKKTNKLTITSTSAPNIATTSPSADPDENVKESTTISYGMPIKTNSKNYGSVVLSTQMSDIVINSNSFSPKAHSAIKYTNQSNLAVPLYSMIPEDSELVRTQSCD